MIPSSKIYTHSLIHVESAGNKPTEGTKLQIITITKHHSLKARVELLIIPNKLLNKTLNRGFPACDKRERL